MPIVLTTAHRRVYDFIEEYIGAPKSTTIAHGLGADLHETQILLSELSQSGLVHRSNRGRYRIAAAYVGD